MIRLGERIRELRLRDGRTQEALAETLGVTAQAVSRWEKGVCYPDMEMIPSIANCFGVTLDTLFGYEGDRAKRAEALAAEINGMIAQNNGQDVCMDACVARAREALIEFPGSESLTLALASALFAAGYVRHGEHHISDRDGYSVYDTERHRRYVEWQEAVKLYEKVLPSIQSGEERRRAVSELSQLYKNTGEREKALRLAEDAPDLDGTRLFLRIGAFSGREELTAAGEALLDTVLHCTELMERIVRTDLHMPPGTAAAMLRNAAGLFDLVCADGDQGRFGAWLACLHMLRSFYLWRAGDRDGAFDALNEALTGAEAYDRLRERGPVPYASPLLRHVTSRAETVPEHSAFRAELPEVWPWWCVPERDRVKSEMQADPRWEAWARRAAGE